MASPLFRTRTQMLLSQVAVSLFFGLHYVLEGASTGAAMNGLALSQALLAIPLGERPGFRVAYLATLPMIALAVLLTWTGLPSVFAAIGFALISLGRYQLTRLRFRGFILLAVPCWMVHNALVGSTPGLIADACAFLTGAWMLRREWLDAQPG